MARGLAADPDLDEHEVGAVDGRVEVARDVQRARVARVVEHPAGHRADDVAPVLVDVVQRQAVEPEPVALAGEARDELRRVRRAGADDGDSHPFTPVSVMPSTNAFWAAKKRRITGSITSSVAAMVRFHCTWCRLRNWDRPIDTTQLSGFSPT